MGTLHRQGVHVARGFVPSYGATAALGVGALAGLLPAILAVRVTVNDTIRY